MNGIPDRRMQIALDERLGEVQALIVGLEPEFAAGLFEDRCAAHPQQHAEPDHQGGEQQQHPTDAAYEPH